MDRRCDKIYQKNTVQGFQQIAIYREVVELDKNSFQSEEKHKYECNQASYSTKDPNNILSKKNISQQGKCKAFRSKTHTQTYTHTLNKSNQFYISKTSQENLVSLHKHMYFL